MSVREIAAKSLISSGSLVSALGTEKLKKGLGSVPEAFFGLKMFGKKYGSIQPICTFCREVHSIHLFLFGKNEG